MSPPPPPCPHFLNKVLGSFLIVNLFCCYFVFQLHSLSIHSLEVVEKREDLVLGAELRTSNHWLEVTLIKMILFVVIICN
jgi:hypothetical protein